MQSNQLSRLLNGHGGVAATDPPPTPVLLSAPDAAHLLGMSLRMFHKLRDTLPMPVVLGVRHVRWRRAELEAWVETLPAKRNGWAPEALNARRRGTPGEPKGEPGGRIAGEQRQRGVLRMADPSNPVERVQP